MFPQSFLSEVRTRAARLSRLQSTPDPLRTELLQFNPEMLNSATLLQESQVETSDVEGGAAGGAAATAEDEIQSTLGVRNEKVN